MDIGTSKIAMSEAEVDKMIVNSCESPSRGTMQEFIIASVRKRREITKDIFGTDQQQQPQFEITAGDASRIFNTKVSFPLDDEAAFETSIHDQDCLGQLEDIDHLNWMKQLARVGIALLGTPDFPLEQSIKPESSPKNTATDNNQQDDQADTVNSENKENLSTANSQSTLRKQLEIATGVTKPHMVGAARVFGKRVWCYRIKDREITRGDIITIQLQ